MVMKEGTQTITFRIPGELKLQIEIEAARQGRSVNNLLKQVVTEYLKHPKK
jgi:predicted HicB family RNase H-like nuclease